MRSRPEEGLQIGVVKLLRLNGFWPVHVPNEGKRSAIGHMRQVAMGLEPGFPDLLVFGPRGTRRALVAALELKRPPRRLKRGGWGKKIDPSAAQRWAQESLEARGVPVIVAHSVEEVIAGMDAIGWPLNGRVSA